MVVDTGMVVDSCFDVIIILDINMRRSLNIQARSGGATATGNAVVRVVDGIKHKRLGSSDIVVSELALGTQRWCGADYNSPSPELCFKMMDRAILGSGVNLIDTAGEPIALPVSYVLVKLL